VRSGQRSFENLSGRVDSGERRFGVPGDLTMNPRHPRYSKEEFERRGTELYERKIRSLLEQGNRGKVVAIDIETGDYEPGEDSLDASEAIIARSPDAQIWCVRIGYPAVDRYGFHPIS
jgi:hypothetical protein